MTKKIMSIIFAVVLVLGSGVSAFAIPERFVFDEASILTYDEIEELNAKAKEITETYGCEVYAITFPGLDGNEAWELNEMLYAELKEYYGAGEDVVILMLAMEERQYDKAMRLIREASKNIADLGDLLKAPKEENLTEEEQKNLQLGLLKLVVVVKEFGK